MNAVIYAAKSTEDKHGSIPTQISDCHAMAQREGWVVAGVFQDEAFSAYSGNRGPGLEQAKALAASTAAQEGSAVLIAQDADRFARGAGDAPGAAEHLGEVYFQLKRQGVALWTVRSGHLDLLRAAFEGERSHDESARKSQAVKAGVHRSVRDKGRATGGPDPYGYRYSDDKNDPGRLIVVPEEATIVRRMFSEYLAGRPQAAIAKGLLDDGVPTKRGGRWGQSTIGRILKNPIYKGMIELRGELFDGQHEPIIEPEVFDKVQALFEARPERRGRPSTTHLFRKGMLRCGACGWALSPRNDGKRDYYYCTGHRQLGRDYCAFPNVRRELIDLAIYSYFEKVALDVEATRKQMTGARDSKLSELQTLVHNAERSERKATEAVTRIKRDYMRGAIGAEDWNELRVELEEERAGALAELERLQQQLSDVESWGAVQDAEQQTLERLTALRAAIAGELRDTAGMEAIRAALLRIFECFVVYVDDSDGRIEAIVRDQAVRTVDEHLRPIFKPTALDLKGLKDDEGLGRKSSQPRSKERTRSSSEDAPDRTMNGVPGSSREATPSASRVRRRTSRPDPSGRPMSSSTTSGRLYSSWRTASRIDSASSTS